MANVIGLLSTGFGVLVVACLAAIASCAVAFAGVVLWTVLTAHRPDPRQDELDRVLAQILGSPPA